MCHRALMLKLHCNAFGHVFFGAKVAPHGYSQGQAE